MTDRHTLFEDDLTRVARERDEARAQLASVDKALLASLAREQHHRQALRRITARYTAGASAGELADIAFEALGGGDD